MFFVFYSVASLLAGIDNQGVSDEVKRLAIQGSLYQGDILMPRGLKNGIPKDSYRWTGYPGKPVVPYIIDESLKNETDVILKAMDVYENSTCIRFVERTDEEDYLHIFSGDGCFSRLGKCGGAQPLSLGHGCAFLGTIIHELGHTLGFYHEQNRSDRDDYLQVRIENVIEDQRRDFMKLESDQNILYTPFSYDSIMIYGNYAFTKNGKMTLLAKTGQTLAEPFEKHELHESDIKRIRLMYKCDE